MKDAVTNAASSVVFTPISRIRDNFEVNFGDTGKIIHQAEMIPKYISWEFLCAKLNKDNRDLGAELHDVVNNEKFDDFAAGFPALIGKTVSAPYTAGVEIGKFIFSAFTKHLAGKKDKQLGILETSYIR